jgi:hypothetical protein
MHRIKTFFIALAIIVIPAISFNCMVLAAEGRNFSNHKGYVPLVQDISSFPGMIDINSKFAGKGGVGKKEKSIGNKHWRRKKGKCTEKRCLRKQKRKYTGNNYWGTRVGYRDGYIIVVEAKENDEKEREKEPNQEEERMREEETRKYLEKINQEDWFR